MKDFSESKRATVAKQKSCLCFLARLHVISTGVHYTEYSVALTKYILAVKERVEASVAVNSVSQYIFFSPFLFSPFSLTQSTDIVFTRLHPGAVLSTTDCSVL